MKRKGHLTFQCIIDYWAEHSNTKLYYGIPGTILSFNVVHVDSVVIIVLLKSKQTSRREKRNFKLD